MCYLIHIGVPNAHAAAVPPGRVPRIERSENPSIAAAFGPSFTLFSIADGGCSCDLYSSTEAARAPRDTSAEKRRKYERLGWSAAKIERALAASEDAGAASPKTSGLRQNIAALVAGIARTADEVRLLVHFYRGRFSEEAVVPRSTRRLSARELETSAYAAIAEDTVYAITVAP